LGRGSASRKKLKRIAKKVRSFTLLPLSRSKRGYKTEYEAKSEVFDYIEGFYNRVRRHNHLDQLRPHEFERQRQHAIP
jgi:transposase InsO family protein